MAPTFATQAASSVNVENTPDPALAAPSGTTSAIRAHNSGLACARMLVRFSFHQAGASKYVWLW